MADNVNDLAFPGASEIESEIESPFSHIAENFPGYTNILNIAYQDMRRQEQNLSTATETHNRYLGLQAQLGSGNLWGQMRYGLMGFGSLFAGDFKERWEFEQAGRQIPEAEKRNYELAISTSERAAWNYNLVLTAPITLADEDSGIASFEDFLSKFPSKYVTDLDKKFAQTVYDNLSFLIPPITESEEIPTTPEELISFLNKGATLPLAGVHNLSMEEIMKSFRAPAVELPEGMDTADVRSLMSEYAFSEDEIAELDGLHMAAEELSQAWIERTAQTEILRATMLSGDVPDLSNAEWLKMLVTQPAMVAFDSMENYFDVAVRPIAAQFIMNFPGIKESSWATEMRQITDDYKSFGDSSWVAYSKAFNESDANWFLKMAVETVFDPTTYIGWGIATKITKPLPYVGKFVGAIERGWNDLWDVPFKLLGKGISTIPKTPVQASFNKAKNFYMDFRALITRTSGGSKILFREVTPDDVLRVGSDAIDFAVANPHIAANTYNGRVGIQLLEHDFIGKPKIVSWLKRLGVAGGDISQQTVHNVNDSWLRYMKKVNLPDEISAELLGVLGVNQIDLKLISRMNKILASELDDIVKAAKGRLVADTAGDALRNVMNELKDVTIRQLESPQYKFARNVGRVTSWSKLIDKVTRSSWMTFVDRRVVAPMANQYLLFLNYGPMNIVESAMRSFIGGGEVFYSKNINQLDELARMCGGLTTVPYELVMEQARLETAIILDSAANTFYKEGSIPLLTKPVGKGLNIRIGAKNVRIRSAQNLFVDLPAEIGTRQRAAYVIGKYKQLLAEAAPDEIRAISSIVDDAAARISNLSSFSRKESRDLIQQVYNASLAGPDAVRSLRSTMKQLDANKAVYELNKTLDPMTEIQSIFKESLRQDARTGVIWKDIDGYMNRAVASAKEFNLAELEAQVDMLRGIADDFAKNAPVDVGEYMTCLQNISDLSSGIGDRISDVRVTARKRAAQLTPVERESFHTANWNSVQKFMDEAEVSLNRVLDQMNDMVQPGGAIKLSDSQRLHATTLIANKKVQVNNLVQTRSAERRITEDWISRKPKFKTNEDSIAWWNSLESARNEPWDRYWRTQESLLELEQEVLTTPPVEIIGDVTPAHVAVLWGGTGDDLSKSLIKPESMTLMGKKEFVAKNRARAAKMAKRMGKADADAVGFTREGLERVYDQLLTTAGLDPRLAEPLAPMMIQFEEVRQELHRVYATKKMPQGDYDAISGFVDKVADDLSGLEIYGGMKQPQVYHATNIGEVSSKTWDLKHSGYTRLGRYGTTDDAIAAAGKIGKAADDIYLVESRGAYDMFYTGKAGKEIAEPPVSKSQQWFETKDAAMLKTREQYVLDFTDYSDQNAVDAAMRMIYPFWTYESSRYKWLPRAILKRPAIATGIGRYMNYSDNGYVPIPGTDMQFNPLRGTVFMGGFRRLYMRDFPEYYDSFPGMEVIDYFSRLGFYPGFHVMLPIVGLGALTGKPEWGELAPAWVKTGFDAVLAVSPDSIAKTLSEQLFPDRFRSYLTIMSLAADGYEGVDLWDRIEKGTATEEENKLWGKYVKKASGLKGVLFEQTGLFRLRPEEYTEFIENSKKLIEELTGVSTEVQDEIQRRYPVTGLRFSDIYPLDPLTQKVVHEIEQYEMWSGITSPLYPSGWQETDRRIREYWEAVENISNKARTDGFLDAEGNMTVPPIEALNEMLVLGQISPEQWLSMRGDALSRSNAAITELKNEAYPDVPVTLDEREAYFAERGVTVPTYHPGQEMLWLYYEQSPEWKWDLETETYGWDYSSYYASIDMLLDSLPDPYKQRFVETIMFNWSPMEKLYWEVNREYIRPYKAAKDVILRTLTEEERNVIRRYSVAKGAEREALKDVIHAETGDKLISWYSSQLSDTHKAMRKLDPEMEAWLMFWGVVDTNLTDESAALYDQFRAKYLVEGMVR